MLTHISVLTPFLPSSSSLPSPARRSPSAALFIFRLAGHRHRLLPQDRAARRVAPRAQGRAAAVRGCERECVRSSQQGCLSSSWSRESVSTQSQGQFRLCLAAGRRETRSRSRCSRLAARSSLSLSHTLQPTAAARYRKGTKREQALHRRGGGRRKREGELFDSLTRARGRGGGGPSGRSEARSLLEVRIVEPEVVLLALAPAPCRRAREQSQLPLFAEQHQGREREGERRTFPVKVEVHALLERVGDGRRLVGALEPGEVLLVEPPRLLLELVRGEVPAGSVESGVSELRCERRTRACEEREGARRTGGRSRGSNRRCRRACRRRAWRRAPGSQTGSTALAGSRSASRTGSAARSTWACARERYRLGQGAAPREARRGTSGTRDALLGVERLRHVGHARLEDLADLAQVLVAAHRCS